LQLGSFAVNACNGSFMNYSQEIMTRIHPCVQGCLKWNKVVYGHIVHQGQKLMNILKIEFDCLVQNLWELFTFEIYTRQYFVNPVPSLSINLVSTKPPIETQCNSPTTVGHNFLVHVDRCSKYSSTFK
jgi:hypothetical protein